MAGISKIAELEARKRALVVQCDICRETLQADVRQLLVHGTTVGKRIDKILSFGPWLLMSVPLIGPLLGLFQHKQAPPQAQRPSKLKGAVAAALVAFRLYRNYGPLVRNLISRFSDRLRHAEKRQPAVRV